MSEKTVTNRSETREDKGAGTANRIVRAAASLLAEGGREAVSTRAVAEAAGVQAPTIYRQFGDMRGLLDEVATYGFSKYLSDKTTREWAEDPVEDLRGGWDLHVGFGLANPALYTLMYGEPKPGTEPTAALEAAEILRDLVQRVAEAGRLRVSVGRAAEMIHAGGMGVVLTLIAQQPQNRDPALSETTREAILSNIITEESDEAGEAAEEHTVRELVANRAIALGAVLSKTEVELTPGERTLLSEWLDRLGDTAR